MRKHTFYEFFAGGGMARAGLGADWQCLFANDFDAKKVEAYKANWDGGEIVCGDIHKLAVSSLPGHADLAWASFPLPRPVTGRKRRGAEGRAGRH
jgi:DNA (cytosine-5)-methyltransferase 1